jgi:hypothetical protein
MHSDDDTVDQPEYSSPPESDVEDLEEITKRNELAYRVFYDLWKDFYDWELTYCINTLSQLSQSPYFTPSILPMAYQHAHWKMPVYDPEEWATVDDTDPQTGSSTQVTISWEALHVTRWKPYPRYTVCTPASRNVKRDEDLVLRSRYAPFADDRDFDIPNFLRRFKDFAWQNDYLDPDCKCALYFVYWSQ